MLRYRLRTLLIVLALAPPGAGRLLVVARYCPRITRRNDIRRAAARTHLVGQTLPRSLELAPCSASQSATCCG